MPLGTIAPWLQLPDFMSAAHAGASIGLQQRKAADDVALERAKLAQSAIESSGRLGLGFTETANAARRAQAEQELAKATMALHQGRYSDLNQQADARHQLGEDRLTALEDNRDTVNDFHDRSLDATVENRALVNALRERGLEATIDNRGVVNGIRQSALDETVKNRGVVNGIRQAALDETVKNHGDVNDLRNRSLDATIDNRADLADYHDRVLGERTANHDRAAGMKTNAPAKAFMVKIPIPANAETGEPATTVSLPSTHPAAKAYLTAHGLGDVPPESATGLIASPTQNQGGETLPLPTQDDANAQAAAALQPRNLTYMGGKTDNPVFDPGTMPAEELAAPAAPPAADKVLSKDLAAGFLKQAKGDKDAARKLARVAGYTF